MTSTHSKLRCNAPPGRAGCLRGAAGRPCRGLWRRRRASSSKSTGLFRTRRFRRARSHPGAATGGPRGARGRRRCHGGAATTRSQGPGGRQGRGAPGRRAVPTASAFKGHPARGRLQNSCRGRRHERAGARGGGGGRRGRRLVVHRPRAGARARLRVGRHHLPLPDVQPHGLRLLPGLDHGRPGSRASFPAAGDSGGAEAATPALRRDGGHGGGRPPPFILAPCGARVGLGLVLEFPGHAPGGGTEAPAAAAGAALAGAIGDAAATTTATAAAAALPAPGAAAAAAATGSLSLRAGPPHGPHDAAAATAAATAAPPAPPAAAAPAPAASRGVRGGARPDGKRIPVVGLWGRRRRRAAGLCCRPALPRCPGGSSGRRPAAAPAAAAGPQPQREHEHDEQPLQRRLQGGEGRQGREGGRVKAAGGHAERERGGAAGGGGGPRGARGDGHRDHRPAADAAHVEGGGRAAGLRGQLPEPGVHGAVGHGGRRGPAPAVAAGLHGQV